VRKWWQKIPWTFGESCCYKAEVEHRVVWTVVIQLHTVAIKWCWKLLWGANSNGTNYSIFICRFRFSMDATLTRLYTGCNWKVRTNFGHEFHIPEQEKMSTTTCVRKYLICDLSLKEYCTCMMVLRHILAVLCELSSITPIITDG
jgi:hypothetical protein